MSATEILRYAAMLMQVVRGLQQMMAVRGMAPAEFDAKVAEECARLDAFPSKVSAEVDAVFSDKD
jgi:hypothetical protein